MDDGSPANGTAGIRATLWDAPSLGNQVGVVDEDTAVVVTDGLFTTELDFGPGAFDGTARYLQIEVMLPYDAGGSYSVLPMRTPVLTVPMAQFANESAQWSTVDGEVMDGVSGQVTISSVGHVGIGGTPTQEALLVENDIRGIVANSVAGTGVVANSLGGTGVIGTGAVAGVQGSGPTGVQAISLSDNGIGLFAQATGVNGLAGYFAGQAEFTGEVGIRNMPVAGHALAVNGDQLSSAILAMGVGRGIRSIASSSVGIGVEAIGGKYGIKGSTTESGLTYAVYGEAADSNSYAGYFVGKGYFSNDTGIGDSTPDARLDVVESSAGAAVSIMERTSNGTIGSDVLRLILPSGSFSAAQFLETRLGTDIRHRLEASGDVYADGGFFPGGADFAELISVPEGAHSVEPGDVMVIDPNALGGFVRSRSTRSTLVAGIYSTKPGVLASPHDWDEIERKLGGTNADGSASSPYELAAKMDQVPLAVVGIVPCKVSTENGPIRPGDLLVTAELPGHAMRDDDPRNGTIVGKALEPLHHGTGVIQVLVTLQ